MGTPEKGLAVTGGVNRAAQLPPFELKHQLTTDQDVDEAGSPDPNTERDRLRRHLRDGDLELMHQALWYAGRRGNISPLHHQRVLRRDIILTERARLHLVWFERTIYVQRLGDELLNWNYFSDIVCGDEVVHQAATGFLLSYTQLIEYPSDLDIAQATGLINKSITWRSWQTFRMCVLHHLADRDIHDRFEYGELRLGRLNQIYRMKCMGLAYFTVYRDHASFFSKNYQSLVGLFALVSVALSAMQVLTNIHDLPEVNVVLYYRFSIATLIGIAVSSMVLLALYAGLYVWNWLLVFVRRRPHRKQGRASD